jgi:hypothetical protein
MDHPPQSNDALAGAWVMRILNDNFKRMFLGSMSRARPASAKAGSPPRSATKPVATTAPFSTSVFPSCSLTLGAALTYARRYALFTLVGIAGEDDLDAPDLGPAQDPGAASPPGTNGQSEPRERIVAGHANGSRSRKHPPAPKQLLQPNASAVLREQLMIELAAIATADEAAVWAQRKLPAKNTLTPDDADVIEQAFRAKLQSVERTGTDEAASTAASGDQRNKFDAQPQPNGPELDTGLPPDTIIISDAPNLALAEDDQNAPALTKPVRKRDKAHRDFVCSQPCLICGRRPSDAHHIRYGQPRALGRKVSDEFTVPLCRVHHRDLHRRSDGKTWWEAAKIEPMEIAQRLWCETRDKTA